MSPITIRVEPPAAPAEASRGELGERVPGRVGLLASPGLVEAQAPDLIEPIVGFRSWRIFRAGAAAGELSSPYFPVTWSQPVLRADCRRFRDTEELLRKPHAAPDPACGCGICARHAPTDQFSTVDFRGVSGIVTVWGRIEVDSEGMRAEHARIEALGLYARWGSWQTRAVREVADVLGVDLVDVRELAVAARSYGEPLPESLLADERPEGVRDRFAALFRSRLDE